MKPENNYEYIDSATLPHFNQYPDAEIGDNVAYNVHTNAIIMSQSNQAYGVTGVTGVTGVNLQNDDVIYEAIGEAEYGGKKSNDFETEANCSYGMHSEVVVSPNGAYGVSIRSNKDVFRI